MSHSVNKTVDRSVVLLSAGLDSTVNFYAALQETQVVLALTFDYGQKAAKKEIEKAKILADLNKTPHLVLELPWLKNLGGSALTSDKNSVPVGKSVSIDNREASEKSAKAVWVPNRNGIFLNIAAGYAESLKANTIVPGFNVEEAATFPDNSFDFLRATRKALTFSTANQVNVQCYTINMTKGELATFGKDLKVPFINTWPCYFSEEQWCGQCESCQRAKRAFRAAHIDIQNNFKS